MPSTTNHPLVLLINPWIYDFAAFDLWIKPLGLLYLARFLEQYGYNFSLIDCLERVENANDKFGTGKFPSEVIEKPIKYQHIPRYYRRYGISPQELRSKLLITQKPCAILITSMMTYWYLGLKDTVLAVKAIFPDVPIVVGGIYPQLCPDHARTTIPADFVLTKKSELAALQILDTICAITRNYDQIRFDLSAIDRPAYHLYKKLSFVGMISSVGCPCRCDYCASHLLQPVFSQRSVTAVINEISYYHNSFNIKNIAFYDDALLINSDHHISCILRQIIEKRFPINFHTPNGLHIREINDDLASLLFAAGFKTLRLSFESSNPKRQEDSSFKINNAKFSAALDCLYKAGFTNKELGVYMMIGLPGQSFEEIYASIDFIASHNVPIKTVQYSPIPGTSYYAEAITKYGFIGNDPLLHNNSIFPLAGLHFSYKDFQLLKNRINSINSALNY